MIASPPKSLPILLLDPEKVKVDAATYQFRSGGDGKGVTEARRYHTDRWDPILHGNPILVHERLNGDVFVADGHHRLDLAKRSNAVGTGPGKIAAFLLREADGYTVEDVRVIAAYKNMARGTTDPIDAARVFKEAKSGKVHKELLPQLQLDNGNLILSYRLSGLSDQALDVAAKGEIPLEMAALVADRVPEPERQNEVVGMLSYAYRQFGFGSQVPIAEIYLSQAKETVPGFVAKLMQQRAQAASQQRLH